jgi:hypothetical protein
MCVMMANDDGVCAINQMQGLGNSIYIYIIIIDSAHAMVFILHKDACNMVPTQKPQKDRNV